MDVKTPGLLHRMGWMRSVQCQMEVRKATGQRQRSWQRFSGTVFGIPPKRMRFWKLPEHPEEPLQTVLANILVTAETIMRF